jgi:isopentenyl phosphate kinase
MELNLLKLGGSLITDKNAAHTARPEVLARLGREIQAALQQHPNLRLVIGHGSGSFGHVAARRHNTRAGVSGPAGWQGFSEVWREARALNQIVVEQLSAAGLPVIAMPPSAAVIARSGQVVRWDLGPMQAALQAGLIPLINGDVIFDEASGGTILSTEELFMVLASKLRPGRILLAGIEMGVWADYPDCKQIIDSITPKNYHEIARQLGGSTAVDVTGGMLSKVNTMLDLVRTQPELEISIFSGARPGILQAVLSGARHGTQIRFEAVG